jgi:hypothetical protein
LFKHASYAAETIRESQVDIALGLMSFATSFTISRDGQLVVKNEDDNRIHNTRGDTNEATHIDGEAWVSREY